MKVEMGLDLGLVSLVIGVHYFAAPLAIPFGHRSDKKPYFGLHRTPYILAGTALSVVATIAIPFVALNLGAKSESLLAALLVALTFLLLGTGIFTAGTAYLSLVADLTPEKERGKAVAVIWSMMMVGILVGVFLGIWILKIYSPEHLVTLFLIMGILVAILTLVAIWGMETRNAPKASPEGLSSRQTWKLMITGHQTRLFFLFLFSGIFFLFLQNVALEPFGGDVLRMSVGQTTRFNAFQMFGVLGGMALAGSWFSSRFGNRVTAGLGLIMAMLSFIGLGAISLSANATWINSAILLMGLGMGLFTVGGLAIMMGMSVDGRTGMYMGTWTLAQALANGLASIGGGAIHDVALLISSSEPIAYAAVFLTETTGLIGTFVLLQRLSLVEFRKEALPSYAD
jgi:BCD family chlorophyll transporter-like MFS transporter